MESSPPPRTPIFNMIKHVHNSVAGRGECGSVRLDLATTADRRLHGRVKGDSPHRGLSGRPGRRADRARRGDRGRRRRSSHGHGVRGTVVEHGGSDVSTSEGRAKGREGGST